MTTARWVRPVAVALLCTIGVGAVILSFSGLARLGELAGYAGLAWIFAVVVDAGAAASTLYWLSGPTASRRVAWARGQALALLAVSVLSNAMAHIVTELPPVLMGVAAVVPPAVLAATVHLLVTPDRPAAELVSATTSSPDPAPVTSSVVSVTGVGSSTPALVPAMDEGARQPGVLTRDTPTAELATLVERATQIEGGLPGRQRLAEVLGCSTHQARLVLDEIRKVAA